MTKKMILFATAAVIMTHGVGVSQAFAAPLPVPVAEEGKDDGGEGDGDHHYTLTIENETGKTITELHLAVSTDDNWTDAEDMLDDDDDLENGESVELTFEADDDIMDATLADIQAKTDGGDMLFENLDISEDIAGHHIVLNKDGSATVTPDDDEEGDEE